MRTLRLIGIGPGDPRQITIEAIEALQDVDVFLSMDKERTRNCGAANKSLSDARREICARYLQGREPRFVEIDDPPRAPNPEDYDAEVRRWHTERAVRVATALAEHTAEDGIAAFLVWGDPSLYDSTLRIAEQVRELGQLKLQVEVVAGISSVAALTAAHQIPANRIGKPIHITTGRRLAEGGSGQCGNQVVMLDANCSFQHSANPGDRIWWGAYLGTRDQILISGTIEEVGAEIVATRARAREQMGWIMDIYLVRSNDD
ncbi:precorrin 6A synthase [Rhodococcus sp. ADH]|uniref:precorrin-6A synthase (deacetylating) n=1 Tax=Nocardiaceae TaxID=85025 RepID=UPI00050C5E2B|nr:MULTISPECIES: precorrin-6A synthase (deacetylating) [Rhodococcus]KPH20750.1 precorrin 6A synthase [Rhodococcus sp. ADH]RGP48011.1 precorrin 6A synthase [Rhodococcus erythropolis]